MRIVCLETHNIIIEVTQYIIIHLHMSGYMIHMIVIHLDVTKYDNKVVRYNNTVATKASGKRIELLAPM